MPFYLFYNPASTKYVRWASEPGTWSYWSTRQYKWNVTAIEDILNAFLFKPKNKLYLIRYAMLLLYYDFIRVSSSNSTLLRLSAAVIFTTLAFYSTCQAGVGSVPFYQLRLAFAWTIRPFKSRCTGLVIQLCASGRVMPVGKPRTSGSASRTLFVRVASRREETNLKEKTVKASSFTSRLNILVEVKLFSKLWLYWI